MKNFLELIVTATMLLTQVASPLHLPATASAQADSVQAESRISYRLQLNTQVPTAIKVVAQKPDFDTEVRAPLQAAQAAKAAAEAQAAQAAATRASIQLASVSSTSNRHVGVATGDIWEQLRICEAGGDYTRNSGNGYYGAYQYNLGTWANYGGFARPDLADPATQDAKARETQAARGWSPWPACARKLGLL